MPAQQFEGFNDGSGGYYNTTVLNDDRLPPGGLPGQVLVKTAHADFYADWMTPLELENSVGPTAPPNPSTGALWLNRNQHGKLEVFDGSVWQPAYDFSGVAVTYARNYISNPGFQYYSRDTSSVLDNGTGPDMWTLSSLNTSAVLSRGNVNSIDYPKASFAGMVVVTRGTAVDRYSYLLQRIQGTAKAFGGTPMTLSFIAQSSNPVKIGIDIVTTGMFDGVLAEQVQMTPQVVQLDANWRKFSFTFTFPISQTFSTQPRLRFWLDAGSNYDSQFPGVGTSSNATVQISLVQLEFGNVATEYEIRPQALETLNVQRFYEILYCRYTVGNQLAGDQIALTIPFKVQKQATPVMAYRATPVLTNVTDVVLSANVQSGFLTGTVVADGSVVVDCIINASVTW